MEENIISGKELPDSIIRNIGEGLTAFNFPVDMEKTYGNSMFPDNYIDLYLKALDSEGKVIYGKLVQNIKILAVKDSEGRHVFENTDEARVPSVLLFAVPEEIHLLLRKALYLGNVREIAAELVPVPTHTSDAAAGKGYIPVISNQELKTFIEINTGLISEDELPDVTLDE